MRRFRVRRPSRVQDGTEQTAPPVSVSESGDAVATGGGDALSGYRGPGPQTDGGIVRVERSGDAVASAAHAVAISGHVSQVLVSAPPPRQPLHWPVRLGSVPVLASAFQDRSAVRDRIDQARVGHTTVVLAQVLSGGGGVGKTQLAAAYAHQALEDGIDLVVWVDASDIEQVIARYAHAAHVVEAAEHLLGKSAESDAGLFLQWLATTRRPWLLILDDLTDPEAMQKWWPPSSAFGCGRVVATTRRHDAVLSGGGRTVVDIDTYSAEEAEAYLHERLDSAHAAHLMDSQAGKLAAALGYLPLALSHAAAYMVNEDVPCADYLHRFNDSTARLDDLLPRAADTEGYGRQVAAALLLSLDVAQASEPVGLAVPVMRLAAILDPAGHPRSLWASDAVTRYLNTQRSVLPNEVAATVDPDQVRAALRLLHRYSLLTDHAQAGSRAVRLHALTARAVRECTPDATVPAVVKTAVDSLRELCDEVSWFDRETTAVLRTNIDSVDACAGDLLWKVEGHYLLRWTLRSLINAGLATAAIPYGQRLTGISEQLLGRTHPMTLIARRDLAWASFLARRHKDAFTLLQEDFPHQDARLARERQGPSPTANGRVHAVALLEDTAAVRARLLGPEDPATLECQVNLAVLYWSRGDRSRATALLEQSLIGCQITFGTDHLYTVSVNNRLSLWREQHKRRWWNRARSQLHPIRPAKTDDAVT
ncbi:tetratricopeptide repeat protein [Streptomyces sp. NPDC001410]|uniref:tetratricopeptide repeat protein n=1 Tax=Streptomyces sp. NPDC001410 TaxID=3364574 RepID=UPI0036CB524F